MGKGGLLEDDSSAVHLLCTSFLLLLHQLHLRPSGVRFQRLGPPNLKNPEFVSIVAKGSVRCLAFAVAESTQVWRALVCIQAAGSCCSVTLAFLCLSCSLSVK